MKKLTLICSALLLSFSMAACGNKANNDNNANNADNTATDVNDTMNGQNDPNENEGTNGNTNNDNTNNNENESKMEVAEEAADRVAELEEVDSATVIVTENNAYAAVVLNEQQHDDEISADVEEKIADEVKKTDNNIENVYVSMNPDFVERMSDYVAKINEGHPISGFFEEFTETVQNVFPDAH